MTGYLSDSNFPTEGKFPHMRFIQLVNSQRQCGGNESTSNKNCYDRILISRNVISAKATEKSLQSFFTLKVFQN